jgi:4-amino-4-deoxy-L-arabinose transferase-like glycosyltransferase
MKIKKEHLILLGILIVGIIVRIIKFDDPDLVMDTVAYSRLGKNLIEYGRYAFGENYNMGIFFPPGYPILIGITNLFLKDLFFSAKLVSFILSCLLIVLTYLITRNLYNKESGLFSAFLFAVYPTIIIVSVQGYSDIPFFFFTLLSIYIFQISLRKNNLLLHALTGVSFGISYLMRPEGLFLLILPMAQIFNVFGDRIYFNRKYLIKTFIISFLFLIVISPYMLFVKSYTGKFSLSGKGNISILLGKLSGDYNYHKIVNAPDNLYDKAAFTLTDDKTELRGWNKKRNLSLKEYFLSDPVDLLRRYQKNVLQEIQVLIKLMIPIILPFFFTFFYSDLFMKKERLIYLFFPFIFFLMYPVFVIIEKQTLLIVVFLLIFSSGGFSNSRDVISNLSRYYGFYGNKISLLLEKGIKPLIIFILVLGSLSYLKYSRFQHFDPAHAKPEEHRRAGLYLKETLSPQYEELNIMARKPYVSFYSDSRFTMLPYADVEDVIYFAKLYDVDFIVIDERSLSAWDYYDRLLEMDKFSDDIELFYEDNSERLIKLFKVKDKF